MAAFAPDEGETIEESTRPFGASPAFIELEPIEDGFVLLSAKGVRESFAPDLSPNEQDVLIATQGPFQGSVLRTPMKAAAWRTKPSWFIVASNDRTIWPEQQAMSAKRIAAQVLNMATAVKLLKHGTLKSYPGLPHGMPTMHADQINADLLAFIKS